MLDKKDAAWWMQEAQKHPEAAVDLIRTLADRLAFLDKQNEELRSDLIGLRRQRIGAGASAANHPDIAALQKRIQELEAALNGTGVEQRLIIYARERIEANLPLDEVRENGMGRTLPIDLSLLLTKPGANLLIITEDARAFSLTVGDLPVPTDTPATLGNPNNICVILDAASFENCRFLTVLTSRGYVYSLLLGTVMQVAKKGDKLIRNLIPDDPVVAAIPSHNADLFAISQKGRWTRFPEKSISGVGSAAMELPKGDIVAAITSLSEDMNLCFLTTEGKLFVRNTTGLATKRGPGASSGLLFKGVTVFGVTNRSDLAIITRRGKLLEIKVSDLAYRAQTDTGTPIPGLEADDAPLSFV
jgi:hypothetical protein